MKKNKLKLRFEPDTRFEVRPLPAAPFRGTLESALDGLKARLLLETLDQTADTELHPPLRRAANEAAALAWTTQFPLLVLPALLEEKVAEARRQYGHQKAVLARSRDLVNEAA